METPTILVADGDPKNTEILRDSLESSGYNVITAADGLQAWQKLMAGESPDLILSEVNLPRLDGFQLLEKLKADSKTSSIPLMFLTNRRDLQDRVRSLRGGVKDYMIKPLHVKEVLARIRMILRRTERLKEDDRESARKLNGRLEEFNPGALIESFGIERKTGVLTLNNQYNRRGEIYFRDGAVVNATLGNLKLEKAVYQMLPWSRGHFMMVFRDINVPDEISVSNLGLLLQGYKRMEERQRLLKKLPAPEAVFETTDTFRQVVRKLQLSADVQKFISLIDGKRDILQIIDESSYDDIKSLERLVKLYQQRFIRSILGSASGKTDDGVLIEEIAEPKIMNEMIAGSDGKEQRRPPAGLEDELSVEETDRSYGWPASGRNGEAENDARRADAEPEEAPSARNNGLESQPASETVRPDNLTLDTNGETAGDRPWAEHVEKSDGDGKITIVSEDFDEPATDVPATSEPESEEKKDKPADMSQIMGKVWKAMEDQGAAELDELAPLELNVPKSAPPLEFESTQPPVERNAQDEGTIAEVELPDAAEMEQDNSPPAEQSKTVEPVTTLVSDFDETVAVEETVQVPQPDTEQQVSISATAPASSRKSDRPEIADEADTKIGKHLGKLTAQQSGGKLWLVVLGRNSGHISAVVRQLVGYSGNSKVFNNPKFEHFERGERLLPDGKKLQVLGVTLDSQFTQLMKTVARDLCGYVVLLEAHRREELSYLSYLVKVLKSNYAVPNGIAAFTDPAQKNLPVETLRDLLGGAADDYIQQIDPAAAAAVEGFLAGLVSDANIAHCLPQPESDASS